MIRRALFWLRLHTKYLLCRIPVPFVTLREFCQDCGASQPFVWHAPAELWRRVMRDDYGIVCPRCFEERAGGLLVWQPQPHVTEIEWGANR